MNSKNRRVLTRLAQSNRKFQCAIREKAGPAVALHNFYLCCCILAFAFYFLPFEFQAKKAF